MVMNISTDARRVFNLLPADGRRLSGIKVKDSLTLGSIEFKKAKRELKAEGLIELGKGRGGTLGRVEGAELPEAPEEERKPTIEENLAHAREEKAAKSKYQKDLDALKDHVKSVGERRFPEADEIVPKLYNQQWYCEVWNDKGASVYFLRAEELL